MAAPSHKTAATPMNVWRRLVSAGVLGLPIIFCSPRCLVAWLGAPSIPPRGVWGLLDHEQPWASPRHRRAWKGNSANFAFTGFSDVHLQVARKGCSEAMRLNNV